MLPLPAVLPALTFSVCSTLQTESLRGEPRSQSPSQPSARGCRPFARSCPVSAHGATGPVRPRGAPSSETQTGGGRCGVPKTSPTPPPPPHPPAPSPCLSQVLTLSPSHFSIPPVNKFGLTHPKKTPLPPSAYSFLSFRIKLQKIMVSICCLPSQLPLTLQSPECACCPHQWLFPALSHPPPLVLLEPSLDLSVLGKYPQVSKAGLDVPSWYLPRSAGLPCLL